MVSYFVSEQPTVERSLVAGPPGGGQQYQPCHEHKMSAQLAMLPMFAKYCSLHMYVSHLAISIVVVLVHDCLSLLVVTLKLHNSCICNLDWWLNVKVYESFLRKKWCCDS